MKSIGEIIMGIIVLAFILGAVFHMLNQPIVYVVPQYINPVSGRLESGWEVACKVENIYYRPDSKECQSVKNDSYETVYVSLGTNFENLLSGKK